MGGSTIGSLKIQGLLCEREQIIFWRPCRAEIDQRRGITRRRIPAQQKHKQATDQGNGKWIVRAASGGGGFPIIGSASSQAKTYLVEIAVLKGEAKEETGRGLNTCSISPPSLPRLCDLGQVKCLF